jgi:hypothetical protein
MLSSGRWFLPVHALPFFFYYSIQLSHSKCLCVTCPRLVFGTSSVCVIQLPNKCSASGCIGLYARSCVLLP